MKIDEEKSYNEMVSGIKNACEVSHADGICKRQTTVCAFCAAGHLIEQGWRREEEVRKETLEQVIAKLAGHLDREFLEKVLGVEV